MDGIYFFYWFFITGSRLMSKDGSQQVLLYKLINAPPSPYCSALIALEATQDVSVMLQKIGQEMIRKSCMRFFVVSVLFPMERNDNQGRQKWSY